MSQSPGREHRTVTRVTTILETAATSPSGVTLGTLAAALAAPKSSVHGLVKGLVATGYLRERDGRYRLGPALAMLPAPSQPDVLAQSHRALEEIESECGETASLSTLVGGSVVYVDIVESRALIRYSAPLRVRRPLYPTSAGKCFLAHLSHGRREAYLREHVAAEDADSVRSELDAVRSDGYAVNRGETVPDVWAAASPIMVGDRVVACLSAAGPHARMAPKLEQIAVFLRTEARQLARGR